MGDGRAILIMEKSVQEWSDKIKTAVLGNVRARCEVQVVSWGMLQRTVFSDPRYSGLLHAVGAGVAG